MSSDNNHDKKIEGMPADFAATLARLDGKKDTSGAFLKMNPNAKKIIISNPVDTREYKIGEHVRSKGIYFGTWEPKDENGKSLGKVFNLFAAPEDLTIHGKTNFYLTDALEYISALNDWHGHGGIGFETHENVLYAAKNHHEKLRQWFVPTGEMLDGKNYHQELVQDDSLMKNYTLFAQNSQLSECCWYWSCSQYPNRLDGFKNVQIGTGRFGGDEPEEHTLSVRPVRAELKFKR